MKASFERIPVGLVRACSQAEITAGCVGRQNLRDVRRAIDAMVSYLTMAINTLATTFLIWVSIAATPVKADIPDPGLPPVVVKLYTADIQIEPNGLETTTIHLELQPTNPAAAQQMGQQPIPFSESMDDVEISEAYTAKADGRKLSVAPSAILTQLPRGASQLPMFDDRREKVIVFPDVSAGDTVAFTYQIHEKQSLIPGQYFSQMVFSRLDAYDEARITLDVPKSLPLTIETHEIDQTKRDKGTNIEYQWRYAAPKPLQQDTAVLSAIDRSPRVLVSSFQSYDEFSRAYAALVAPKVAVTPDIQALADKITGGITDRHEQAKRLYEWVSEHVRYVALEFGTGAIIPHDAGSVLANGYGDCKDHVVLFSALLKAKGIESEMALINLGNDYSLPSTPVIGELNHVITWIPEFQIYADTTAGVAPFGVLPFQEYGKPVVHVVSSGPSVHHIPVLAPGIASETIRTTAHLDDQGDIIGQTETTATGPFLIVLRQVGVAVQAHGPERTAQALLQQANLPGTASFDVGAPAQFSDDYMLGSTFTIGPFKEIELGQRLAMPSKFEVLGATGDGLVGPLLNVKVTDADQTPCYSGNAVEDISVTAPPGRHFLAPPPDVSIKTANLSFVSRWSASGDTIKVHREVVTKFDTALCAGPVRADMAKAIPTIRQNFGLGVALAVDPISTH